MPRAATQPIVIVEQTSYGLQENEYRVAGKSVFVDGDALDGKANAASIISDFLGSSLKPAHVTVIFAPGTLPLKEQALKSEIVKAGGTVAIRKFHELFEDAVARKIPALKTEPGLPQRVVHPAALPNTTAKVYSSSRYSIKDRRALRKAYQTEPDSLAIVS